MEDFRALAEASLGDSEDAVEQAAQAVGYLGSDDAPAYRRAVVDMVFVAAEPAQFPGSYDFAAADLSDRLSEHVKRMHTEQGFGRLPPPDMLYIHRKLGGLYLLLKRLGAKVPMSELIALAAVGDVADLNAALEKVLARDGLRTFLLNTFAPLSRAVGELWAAGRLQVFEEHLITRHLVRFLDVATSRLARPPGNAVGEKNISRFALNGVDPWGCMQDLDGLIDALSERRDARRGARGGH